MGETGINHALMECSITGADQQSAWVPIRGKFNLSISGTWTATIYIQRSFDGGSTALDVESFTSNVEKIGEEPETVLYRANCKTGDYTSGTAIVRISQ